MVGEFDGVSSLIAGLEGNLGIALLLTGSLSDHGDRQRIVSHGLGSKDKVAEVGAGYSNQTQPTRQLPAFIDELKKAAISIEFSHSADSSSP